MDEVQQIQESEYIFPYHHLVTLSPFSEYRHLFWGYKYAAYVEKVLETLQTYSFASIVDVGCGDGKITADIAKRFPGTRVVGLDYSERALAFARAFSPSVEFKTSTPETFEAFVCVEVLEHIPPAEMESFLAGVCANLKQGAIGVFTTPCDTSPLVPKHYQHFSKEKIYAILGARFEIERFEYISAETFGARVLQRFFANRFFILNYAPLVAWLHRFYKRRYLNTHRELAGQVFVVVRKK